MLGIKAFAEGLDKEKADLMTSVLDQYEEQIGKNILKLRKGKNYKVTQIILFEGSLVLSFSLPLSVGVCKCMYHLWCNKQKILLQKFTESIIPL